MRTYGKISLTDRKRIFEAYEEEKDWRAMAKALGVNERTAYEWIRRGQKSPKAKGGSVTKKTDAIDDALDEWISENPSITLANLVDLIITNFNITVSINTVKNWLDGKAYSVKDVRTVIHNMNLPVNKEKRATYLSRLFYARSTGRTIMWVDEINFNLYCKRKEGRSKIGTRASIILPASNEANLHCIGAIIVKI